MRKIVGYVLLSVPFLAIFVYYTIIAAFWIPLAAFSIAAIIVGCIFWGVRLILD